MRLPVLPPSPSSFDTLEEKWFSRFTDPSRRLPKSIPPPRDGQSLGDPVADAWFR